MRRWIQGASALLQNGYLAFPWTGNLYQGPLKRLCTPGLNCYSCPAALVSCPLGTLQHFVGSLRPALRWGTYRLGFYVVGFLVAVGLVFGRFPCGWLCPFGLLQEGLHKIPSPALPVPRRLAWFRYAALGVLVLLLPLTVLGSLGYGEAWFCRLACPAGTLEASGLLSILPGLREQIGPTFLWKIGLLAFFLGWAVVSFRPYCRVLCPLGAIYGIFNRWSLLRVEHDPSRCAGCGCCAEGCEMDLEPRRDGRSSLCVRCFGCALRHCPEGALVLKLGNVRLPLRSCAPHSTPNS